MSPEQEEKLKALVDTAYAELEHDGLSGLDLLNSFLTLHQELGLARLIVQLNNLHV